VFIIPDYFAGLITSGKILFDNNHYITALNVKNIKKISEMKY